MSPRLFLDIALVPALRLLPPAMDSDSAKAMLVAICLQESGLTVRQQSNGPARGYAQFERAGVLAVMQLGTTSHEVTKACLALDVPVDVSYVFAAIAYNDVLACVLARLLLWSLPQSLPAQSDTQGGWNQYMAAWRPGKPRRSDWDGNYARAWDLITAKENA